VVNLLLHAGAEKEATTKEGHTALYMASERGHEAVVALLEGASDGDWLDGLAIGKLSRSTINKLRPSTLTRTQIEHC
jgi:ankyrin repeat protein